MINYIHQLSQFATSDNNNNSQPGPSIFQPLKRLSPSQVKMILPKGMVFTKDNTHKTLRGLQVLCHKLEFNRGQDTVIWNYETLKLWNEGFIQVIDTDIALQRVQKESSGTFILKISREWISWLIENPKLEEAKTPQASPWVIVTFKGDNLRYEDLLTKGLATIILERYDLTKILNDQGQSFDKREIFKKKEVSNQTLGNYTSAPSIDRDEEVRKLRADNQRLWKEKNELEERVRSLEAEKRAKNNAISIKEASRLQRRFADSVTLENQLNQITSSLSHQWRELGAALQFQTSEIDELEKKEQPVRELLKKWQHKQDATVLTLIAALDTIDNYTAIKLLREWIR